MQKWGVHEPGRLPCCDALTRDGIFAFENRMLPDVLFAIYSHQGDHNAISFSLSRKDTKLASKYFGYLVLASLKRYSCWQLYCFTFPSPYLTMPPTSFFFTPFSVENEWNHLSMSVLYWSQLPHDPPLSIFKALLMVTKSGDWLFL